MEGKPFLGLFGEKKWGQQRGERSAGEKHRDISLHFTRSVSLSARRRDVRGTLGTEGSAAAYGYLEIDSRSRRRYVTLRPRQRMRRKKNIAERTALGRRYAETETKDTAVDKIVTKYKCADSVHFHLEHDASLGEE